MSIVRCDHCERQIDSDVDVWCFVEPPDYLPLTEKQRRDMSQTLCEPCRETEWDRQQNAAMECAP